MVNRDQHMTNRLTFMPVPGYMRDFYFVYSKVSINVGMAHDTSTFLNI